MNETGVLGRQTSTNAFKAIEGGWGDAMLTIAGGKSIASFMQSPILWNPAFTGTVAVDANNESQVVSQILDALNNGKTMWLASFQKDPASGVSELVPGHAYALEDPSKSNSADTSALVQNPWGVTVDSQGNLNAGANFKSPFIRTMADLVHSIVTASGNFVSYVVQVLDYSAGNSNLAPVFYNPDGTPSSTPPTNAIKTSGSASAARLNAALVESTQAASSPVTVPLTPSVEKEVRDISDTAALYLSSDQKWQILPAKSKFSAILNININGTGITDDTFDALALRVEKLGTSSTNAGTQALTKLSPVSASSGYVLLLRDYSDFNAFKVAYVDANGSLDRASIKAISAAQLYTLESAYGEDLNGSDSIGDQSIVLDDGDFTVSELADSTVRISSGNVALGSNLTVSLNGKAASFAELGTSGYSYDGLDSLKDAAGKVKGFVLYLYDTNSGNELSMNLDATGAVTGIDVNVIGTAADDTLSGGSGNDTLSGGAGTDTAVMLGQLRGYKLSVANGSGTVADSIGARDGVDTLSSIEHVRFSDFDVNTTVKALASAAGPATVARIVELYAAFFHRIPDADGLAYWLTQVRGGVSVNAIADTFYGLALQNPAFSGLSASGSVADFVNLVYRNVLGRAQGADASGLAFWSNELSSGHATRGSVVFSMVDAAYNLKGDASWGWVANYVDNTVTVARQVAVDWGLNSLSAAASITNDTAIAKAITPTDTSAAIALVGVPVGSVTIG